MKIVINTCWGGFGLSEKAIKDLGIEDDFEIDRTDSKLIALIEEKGSDYVSEEDYSQLRIIEIPEESTDYKIDEYDGMETVIYVLDGKIRYAT